jgi:hypothetical protein
MPEKSKGQVGVTHMIGGNQSIRMIFVCWIEG